MNITRRAYDAFRDAYNGGLNFMTPEILKRGEVGPSLFVELSRGSGISGEPIFGVTVLEDVGNGGTARRPDLSRLFHSTSAAERYIATLGCIHMIYRDDHGDVVWFQDGEWWAMGDEWLRPVSTEAPTESPDHMGPIAHCIRGTA